MNEAKKGGKGNDLAEPIQDPMLTTIEVCELTGLARGTWDAYVSRGYAPAPEYFGRTRYWRLSTIQRWLANRPGRGHQRPPLGPLEPG